MNNHHKAVRPIQFTNWQYMLRTPNRKVHYQSLMLAL